MQFSESERYYVYIKMLNLVKCLTLERQRFKERFREKPTQEIIENSGPSGMTCQLLFYESHILKQFCHILGLSLALTCLSEFVSFMGFKRKLFDDTLLMIL